MKKGVFAVLFILMLIAALALAACGGREPEEVQAPPENVPTGSPDGIVERGYQSGMEKDYITIRGVRPQSGADAIYEQTAFGPQYRMWVDEINKAGGLYVKSLDRQVLVDMQVYDDESDVTRTAQLFEQVCLDDRPDLVIAPAGTAALMECSPIAQKHGYLLLSAEGGTRDLEKYLPPAGENSNTFMVLNYSATQVPALAKLFEELEVESVYCVYVDDRYGIEYWDATKNELDRLGIEVKGIQSVPLDEDFDAGAVVQSAKTSGAGAFLLYTYPKAGMAITMEAMRLAYNPDVYLVGQGGCLDSFGLEVFGDETNFSLDGMLCLGAWSAESASHGERAGEYSEYFRDYWTGKGVFWKDAEGSFNPAGSVFQDWWGQICYYSVMQVMQQAVENAGELEADGKLYNPTLVNYIRLNSFDTVMHPELRFRNNVLTDDMYPGNVGQWQDGVFQVVDADGRRTADPVYPKPPWQGAW